MSKSKHALISQLSGQNIKVNGSTDRFTPKRHITHTPPQPEPASFNYIDIVCLFTVYFFPFYIFLLFFWQFTFMPQRQGKRFPAEAGAGAGGRSSRQPAALTCHKKWKIIASQGRNGKVSAGRAPASTAADNRNERRHLNQAEGEAVALEDCPLQHFTPRTKLLHINLKRVAKRDVGTSSGGR